MVQNMRRQIAQPASSRFQQCCYAFGDQAIGILGAISSVGNVNYAVSVTYFDQAAEITPDKVSFGWFQSLSSTSKLGAIYNGASTLIVSSIFCYRFIRIARAKFCEEYNLFKQRLNTKRFITETIMAILAAIPGSAIYGAAYQGITKWIASCIGFLAFGGLSFLGMHDLILRLFDADYAFKMKVLDHLKRIEPRHLEQINHMLDGKQLNNDSLNEFLTKLFTLAEQVETQKRQQAQQTTRTEQSQPELKTPEKTDQKDPVQREQKTQPEQQTTTSVFREKTEAEIKAEKRRSIIDYTLAGSLALFCSTMYFQTGFEGVNILAFDSFSALTGAAQFALGFLPGLPLTLFALFTMRFLNIALREMHPNVGEQPCSIAKTLGLVGLCAGNATWYMGLAKFTAANPGIFSFLLTSTIGGVFPWAAFLTCLNMGINGLTPMVYSPKINTDRPQVKDVFNYLMQTPATVIRGLRSHSFFQRPVAALQEIRTEPQLALRG